MTKATIESGRPAKVASWITAALLFAAGALFLRLMPKAEPVSPAHHDKLGRAVRDDEKKSRPLPEEYARIMVESAELRVREELAARLERFETMSSEVYQKKSSILDDIEARSLPLGMPPAINDTSAARGPTHEDLPPIGVRPSIHQLYERIAEFEITIQNDHLATLAARRALASGLSFPETLRATRFDMTRMQDFSGLVASTNLEHGIDSRTMTLTSIQDINRYREFLAQISRQSGLAESRLQGMIHPMGRQPPPELGSVSSAQSEGGEGESEAGDGSAGPLVHHQASFADERMVAAEALPGRRVSRETARRGWLYVNTWYMIGPWDSYGRNDYSLVHPPEHGIDFDAVYHDGKIGTGTEEKDSHPLRVRGREVILDGTLRWKFMQSESMHNTVPVTTGRSTYYAYTELYFDEPSTMIVAIGTDDSGKLWINGREIWQDAGNSWYHIDEHIERFDFQQGWNRILVRLCNNGGAATGFSLLLCPPGSDMVGGAGR